MATLHEVVIIGHRVSERFVGHELLLQGEEVIDLFYFCTGVRDAKFYKNSEFSKTRKGGTGLA